MKMKGFFNSSLTVYAIFMMINSFITIEKTINYSKEYCNIQKKIIFDF